VPSFPSVLFFSSSLLLFFSSSLLLSLYFIPVIIGFVQKKEGKVRGSRRERGWREKEREEKEVWLEMEEEEWRKEIGKKKEEELKKKTNITEKRI
jgi:hypothetical protein